MPKTSGQGKDDKDNLGCFVQYRVAFYCAGDEDSLTNFFMLLDSFLSFRVKQYARASPFEVHIYGGSEDLSGLGENLSYSPLVIHDSSDVPPLKWHEAHPVVGTGLLTLHFEPVSDTFLNLVITGKRLVIANVRLQTVS